MKDVERIYICKSNIDNKNVIDTVLVQYTNNKFDYFGLPSYYRKLDDDKKLEEEKIINEEVDKYINEFKKEGCLNKIINVSNKDIELRKYVDYQMSVVDDKCLDKVNINSLLISGGTTLLSDLVNPPISILFNIISTLSVLSTLDIEKKKKVLANKTLKHLRRTFSYILLGINLGLGIRNLNITLDTLNNNYTLEQEDNKKLSINNPFSDTDTVNSLTTTTAITNLLLSSFEENDSLSEEDLQVAQSLYDYLSNNPYLDYKYLYEKFATIGIMHTDYDGGNLAGMYIEDNESIIIYDSNRIDSKYTLLHELIHVTGDLDNIMLDEGMTELLCGEYFNDGNTKTYSNHVLITKIFCELIGPDKMLEAYSKRNMSIIKNELLKIDSNKQNYYDLINTLNSYALTYYVAGVNNEDIVSDIDTETLYYVLSPYINSDLVDDNTRENINEYIDLLNSKDTGNKMYFNTDSEYDKVLNKNVGKTN